MSGGVDSSAAAYLLKEEGYDVIGVTMRLWDPSASDPAGPAPWEDAAAVCRVLGIPHHVLDFREAFHREVVSYFTEEYLRGRTPNPCVVCNRKIKWEALLEAARSLGAGRVATGHYARILRLPNGRLSVCNAASAAKDQTYALFGLTQDQLAKTLMPVGDYEKGQVREFARLAGLPVAEKADSQDICFIPDGDYGAFIDRQAPGRVPGPGRFVYRDGRDLGSHRGITHYTIGQRRGLGIAMGHHVFVTGIEPGGDIVRIGESEDLFTDSLVCRSVNMMAVPDLPAGESLRALGRIRYAHRGEACTLTMLEGGELLARFDRPVRAITPGQAAVFYQDDHILCGGFIEGPGPEEQN